MDTLIIQLTNQRAYKLLQELEDLHLIRVLKTNFHTTQQLSEKYAGKIPSNVADELQLFVAQSRDEWNQNNI
jgi:hypothetical protein